MLEIIEDFLKIKKYTNNKNVTGIILYGSYVQNFEGTHSDIDLLIVFHDESEKINRKGYKLYKNNKFEYFEKNLKYLYKRADDDYKNGEDTLYSIVTTGNILLDKEGEILELKNYISEKYKDGCAICSIEEKKYLAVELKICIDRLINMFKRKSSYMNIYYGIVLNKIVYFYSKIQGTSNIQSSKIFEIYKNNEIAKRQNKTLPDREFMNGYIECVENICLNKIVELFKYSVKGIYIDFNDVNIDLKERKY
jgi:predicted nucleotidyltransferase